MVIEHLTRVVPAPPGGPDDDNASHPMRRLTRDVAFGYAVWTAEHATRLAELFSALAPGWNERVHARHTAPLEDALARGGTFAPGPCLEIGSGTGNMTPVLTGRFGRVVVADIAMGMLRLAPSAPAPRTCADAAALPFPEGVFSTAVLVNALLFPAEVDRVLGPDGALVWVNTIGDRTPIHLSAEDVERAMGDGWRGCASEAGWGTWAVLRRAAKP